MQGGGARPLAFRVRLYLREGVLDLGTVLMARGPVFVSVPFFAMRATMLVVLPFGASARVDVPSEVERIGLGQIAHFELYEDPVRSVLEGGRAANTGVMLGAQFELYVIAVGSVAMLVGLGTAIVQPTSKKRAASPTTHRSIGIPLTREKIPSERERCIVRRAVENPSLAALGNSQHV